MFFLILTIKRELKSSEKCGKNLINQKNINMSRNQDNKISKILNFSLKKILNLKKKNTYFIKKWLILLKIYFYLFKLDKLNKILSGDNYK